MKKIRIINGLTFAAIFTLLLVFTNQQPLLHSEASEKSLKETEIQTKEEASPAVSNQQAAVRLTDEEIGELTDRFMDELVQNTDQWYRVVNYQTKEAFIKDFMEFTSRKVAEKYIHTYYVQEEDGVYVIPTSTPPWFQKGQAYERIQTNENTVKVVQHNISELHGEYTIELEFTFNDKWRITDTRHY